MTSKELPLGHLATQTKDGKRVYLYPTYVKGKWNTLRSRFSVFLIFLFLYLPWMRIGGHPAVLLDIAHRRFAIFGVTFWAHDAPMLFFILGSMVVSILFVTSIWGRAWCGWACPQTVFIEHVFRRVERWIEGNAVFQKRLAQAPFSLKTLSKRTLKWVLFTALALVISHSFLAYFVGTEELARMIRSSPLENTGSFFVMALVSGGILFNFGWFREQFCIVACPYGRFQSVLMDDRSMIVAYDAKRGTLEGDCVNCYRCVQACPNGIDIRRGLQMECTACAACMDACDDVMTRLKRPPGLIRYFHENPIQNYSRSSIYLALLLIPVGGLAWKLTTRTPIELAFVRAIEAPYQEVPGTDGKLLYLNHLKAELRNQSLEPIQVHFDFTPDWINKGLKLVISNHSETLAPDQLERADLFIQIPKGVVPHGGVMIPLEVTVRSSLHSEPIHFHREVRVVTPLVEH